MRNLESTGSWLLRRPYLPSLTRSPTSCQLVVSTVPRDPPDWLSGPQIQMDREVEGLYEDALWPREIPILHRKANGFLNRAQAALGAGEAFLHFEVAPETSVRLSLEFLRLLRLGEATVRQLLVGSPIRPTPRNSMKKKKTRFNEPTSRQSTQDANVASPTHALLPESFAVCQP